MSEIIITGIISAVIGSAITLFIVGVSRSNREHEIYVEGYIAGTKAKKNEDKFGVKENDDNE